MITQGLAVLAVIQVGLGSCVDNEHVVNPLETHHQHLNYPHSPALPLLPNSESPCDCCQCPCPGPSPCPSPCPNPYTCANELEYPLPCIQSLTKFGNNPCAFPYGPVLQSAIGNPLCCCDPLVPVIQNHVGHQLVKFVKHIPVVRKYCKPELVIRTRNVPVVKHKKHIFLEPYTVHIPVTDKLVRQVIHQYQIKVPVVHKCIKPYTYQTVRHVPASVAKSLPRQCSPCADSPLPYPYPLGPEFPPSACGCESPCPQLCDQCAQPLTSPCPCSLPDESSCPCSSPCPCKP